MDKASRKKEKSLVLIALGQRLKELRNTKSQKEVSGVLDIKPSVLSSYELGEREPNLYTLNKIAKHYSVTVDYLTGNSDTMNPDIELLSKILPFSEKTISRLIDLNSMTNGLFGEVVSKKSFELLVNGLNTYKSMNEESINNYCYIDTIGIANPTPYLQKKKDIVKPHLDRTLLSLLEDLD